MGVLRRRRLLVIAAVLSVVLCEGAGAATTTYDPYGTTLLDGRKVFPIVLAKGPERGGETPTRADALDEVVAAGVNFFKVGPADTAWNDADLLDALAWNEEAATRGVHNWVNLATLSRAQPGTPQHTRLEQVVTELKGDAFADAIGMWKGADEPWWAKTPASQLQFAYCLSTSRGDPGWCAGEPFVDSDHLWVTIQAPRGTAAELAPYTAVTDIHGVDDYPVTYGNTNPNLHEVGTWTDTIASITPSHAVWTTLQVCASGSDDPGGSGQFVLPTKEQERYMIYDAIINGARNLAFYGGNIFRCWTPEDAALQWNWTFWDTVLEDLIGEINAVSPIAPALVNPASTERPTSSDPTTQVISRRGATADDLWVIAARSGAGTQDVTIGGLPAGAINGTVYTEGRSVTATNGSFTDTLSPWDVNVYHFTIAPPPPPPPASSPPASPPPVGPPPSAAQRTALKLRSAGTSTVPARAVAGRKFSFRVRVATNTGEPVRTGAIKCSARIGKKPLRPVSKGWARGRAFCTWRLPKSASGKRLRGSVRVQSRGLSLVQAFARRIR